MKAINQLLFFILLMTAATENALASKQFPSSAQKNKAVLITGASSGIGRNMTETLASQGYLVYAGARKDKDMQSLNQIPNVIAVRLDVTVQSDIDKAVEMIEEAGLGLFGLVNNAGVALFEPLIEIEEKDLAFQMDVNVFGPYRVTKAFAPLIMESRGRIINIGSVAGLATGAMFGPYSMSKFSIEAFSEALASEMRKFEVGVSVIEPGNYNSKVMSNLEKRQAQIDEKSKHSLYQAEYQRMAKFTQPDRSRYKDPDDVSNAVTAILESAKPNLRYMVVPSEQEATYPIKKTISKLVELNYSQAFRFSRKQIIQWLDQELTSQTIKSGTSQTSKVTVTDRAPQAVAE